MATKLTFTKDQLHNLNTYFSKLVDESQNGECLNELLDKNLTLWFGKQWKDYDRKDVENNENIEFKRKL